MDAGHVGNNGVPSVQGVIYDVGPVDPACLSCFFEGQFIARVEIHGDKRVGFDEASDQTGARFWIQDAKFIEFEFFTQTFEKPERVCSIFDIGVKRRSGLCSQLVMVRSRWRGDALLQFWAEEKEPRASKGWTGRFPNLVPSFQESFAVGA